MVLFDCGCAAMVGYSKISDSFHIFYMLTDTRNSSLHFKLALVVYTADYFEFLKGEQTSCEGQVETLAPENVDQKERASKDEVRQD